MLLRISPNPHSFVCWVGRIVIYIELDEMSNSTVPRLRTNVIDYRPLTASQVASCLAKPEGGTHHQTYQNRSVSPVSIMRLPQSSRVPKEQIYRTILEKNEFDMDKLLQNLPESIIMTPRRYTGNDRSGKGFLKKGFSGGSGRAVSSKDGRNVVGPGVASVPCSSRRDKGSSRLRTQGNRPSTVIQEEDAADQKLRSPAKKDVLLKHVFAVNGSVVAFKSCGYENFTNWFGDENMLR